MTDQPTDVLRPLRQTRQVREFTPTPLPAHVLDALADVARWTGSSENSQPWRFIVIRDRATIQRIHDAGAPQTRSLLTAPAALAIVLAGDPGDLEHAFDEGRAAERLLIGAGMLDLAAGVAWVTTSARPLVGEILGLPEDHFVRTVVALGHPSEAAMRPKSAPGAARLPASETILREHWPQG